MAEYTYHKAQIIPGDPNTWVYWTQKDGKARDISHSDIPKDAKTVDETHNRGKT